MNLTKESESYYSKFDSEKFDLEPVHPLGDFKFTKDFKPKSGIEHIHSGNVNTSTEVDKDKINLLFDYKDSLDLLQWILDEEGESLSSRVYNKINHFLNGNT